MLASAPRNSLGCFHKWGVPQNGWFIKENPSQMDDLGDASMCFFRAGTEAGDTEISYRNMLRVQRSCTTDRRPGRCLKDPLP